MSEPRINPLDTLNFRQAATDVLNSLAKEGAKSAVMATLKNQLPQALVSVAAEAASAATLSIIKPFFSAILKATDESSRHLKKLIGLPLETGLRIAQETLELTREANGELWLQRANQAISELEKAYTHSDKPMRARIRLIQGLLAIQMGENGYASRWLCEFILFLEEQIDTQFEPCRKLRERASLDFYGLDPITKAVYIKDGGNRDEYKRECKDDLEQAVLLEKQINANVSEARHLITTLKRFYQTP